MQLAQYLQHADVLEAMQRITVVHDSELTHYHHCRIEITAPSSGTTSQSVLAPRGSPQDALSDDEVIGKFRMLAEPVVSRERAQRAVADCMALETVANVGDVLASLSA